MKRPAFTIVELMVAVAILIILTSITMLFLSATRRNSRDATRKADVQTISSAMSQYTVVAGNTFVRVSGQTCVLPDDSIPANAPNFTTNPGCVGASGRAYGKMNLRSTSTTAVGNSGYATNPGRTYATTSINQALQGAGYLNTIPHDPVAKVSDATNPSASDYVLIRACANTGQQSVGVTGAVFGVWTALENLPTDQEKGNSDRYPGGKSAGPVTGAGTYIYDFAAQQTEWNAGSFYINGFAVGNGITKTVSSLSCFTGPKPA
jgi:type II secretory pathway pseudopilin PulG